MLNREPKNREPQALRASVVAEARKWIGTPYISNAMVVGAGVDCAMLLVAVYRSVGLIPKDFDPRPYPPNWHLHQREERYKNFVESLGAKEFPGPPEAGDIVMFKIGYTFAHGGIVTEWPKIVHARAPGKCWEENVSLDSFGRHALWLAERKFYSILAECP